MSPRVTDGAAVRFPPPLVFLGGIGAGALLHAFALPLPLGLPTSLRITLTTICIGLGLLLLGVANRPFQKTGQDPKPWRSTPEIISTGIYRFTRNPMYVGMALLQVGVGVGTAIGWIVALVPPVLWIVYATAIRPEEAYLEDKFGEAYTDYKASVRRWV